MYISFRAISHKSVKSFHLNNPISCSPSVELSLGLLYFSNRRNTEHERSVRNTKTLNQLLETVIAKSSLKISSNGLSSSFLFATVLVAFIALEGNGSRAVQIHSQY